MIRGFLAAVSFLTCLPVGRWFVFDKEAVARSARWFPMVGAMLGAIFAGVLLLLVRVLPPLVSAVIAVAVLARLTGAMHLDGLADTADGFGGGRTRDDVLRIMRDHSIGAYAGVALILVLALKVASISALAAADTLVPALVLAPVLGRWSSVLLSATQPYARPGNDAAGTAGAPTRLVGRVELIVATVIALAFAALLDPLRGLVSSASVALLTAAWAWRCRQKIGGVTGDTLGAVIEASECLVLLLFLGIP